MPTNPESEFTNMNTAAVAAADFTVAHRFSKIIGERNIPPPTPISPLKNPIPVKTGFHNVTYIEPNYIIALEEHFTRDEINFLLKESTKKIYVSSNETVFINLWWKQYEDTIKNRKKMKWIRTSLSAIIISILIILNS